jgi:uncharacterized membrane protein YagU involved in acid resistance
MTRATTIADGLIGGAAGAGCMSVLRMAARRWGLIDVTPPQATKAKLTEMVGMAPDSGGAHHLLDSLVHLGVGLTGGALYGAVARPGRRPALAGGALFGLGVWAAAFGVLAPALGITKSPFRATLKENAVNVGAHLLYGTAIALVTGELGRQAAGRGVDPRGLRARVG